MIDFLLLYDISQYYYYFQYTDLVENIILFYNLVILWIIYFYI